jgi:hypothetical protein
MNYLQRVGTLAGGMFLFAALGGAQSEVKTDDANPLGQEAAPVTGKSSVSGTVINAKTHEPIKKAAVMLNGATSLSAVTDAGGNFSFRSLPAGTYWVMANQADFSAKQRRGQMAQSVTVGEGEEKSGLEVALQPGASVSGRVLNEDGQPVPHCSVTAARVTPGQKSGTWFTMGGSTDSEGTYHIHGLAAGRYVIHTRCNASFPAPHGFMRVNDPDIPTEGYAPVSTPSAIQMEAGADLGGVDFHVQRSRMFSVRVTLSGMDMALAPRTSVSILSKDSTDEEDVGMPGRGNPRHGEFLFRNVTAGSYEVLATILSEDKAYQGRQEVQVGGSPLSEVELKMVSGMKISGWVVEDDPNIPLEGQQVALLPVRESIGVPVGVPVNPAQVAKDGTFEFKSVLPGHYSLSGMQGGFFKSVTLGGREVAPTDMEINGEGAAVLHISLSSRYGKVHVSAESQPAAGEMVAAVLLPMDGGQPMVMFSTGPSPVDIEMPNVAPGKYHVLLVSSDNPWPIVTDAGAQKALEDHMATITVGEVSDQRIGLAIVGREAFATVLDSIEN